MMRLIRWRSLGVLLGMTWTGMTAPAAGQATRDIELAVSPAILQRVNEARMLLDRGESEVALVLLDSLAQEAPPDSPDLAEVLYWRATVAGRLVDAERDWRRIIVEVPLSPRTPEVLLRLGDLAMLRQQPEEARRYLERVVRDFPESPQRVQAMEWLARRAADERPIARPPATDSASSATPPTSSAEPTGLRSAEPVVDSANRSVPLAGGFAVQIGAYDTEAEARETVTRMKQRSFDARIDGIAKPFRVRIGRFATRADAMTLLKQIRAIGINAFVAELTP